MLKSDIFVSLATDSAANSFHSFPETERQIHSNPQNHAPDYLVLLSEAMSEWSAMLKAVGYSSSRYKEVCKKYSHRGQ